MASLSVFILPFSMSQWRVPSTQYTEKERGTRAIKGNGTGVGLEPVTSRPVCHMPEAYAPTSDHVVSHEVAQFTINT